MDFKGLRIYVGCVLQQRVENKPERTIDLGQYNTPEEAARVRDFYVYHKGWTNP